MSPDLEQYFDNYNTLFNSSGWQQFASELSNKILQLSELDSIKDSDDLYFRKGQIDACRAILAMPDSVALARQQAEGEVEDVEDL